MRGRRLRWPAVRGRRGRQVALGAVVLALALIVGTVLRSRATGTRDAAAPTPPWWSKVVEALSASHESFEPVADAASSAAERHGPDERQICGGAWVKLGADGAVEGEPPNAEAEIAALRTQTIARLRSDRDEYARAVAAWMGDGDEAALVDLAVGTHDARVYALAFQSCQRMAVESCRLLNARQWARLDAGNAAPWLFLLSEAALRKDAGGVDEALFQIGAAARSENGIFRPMLPILDAVPADDRSVPATVGLAMQALGKVMATIPPLASVRPACSGAALADANRRQLCERVADVLTDRSDDLITRNIGARIATELSGSPARYDRQRAELDAWVASSPSLAAADPVEAFGCRRLRGLLDRVRSQALLGEVGAVRRWVADSGLSDADLQARSSAFNRQASAAGAAIRKAEAAASAASMPP